MIIGACSIELYLHDPESLKDKRSVLKGLFARLHKEFNVSAGEVGLNDVWKSATIGVAVVSNNAIHASHVLENIVAWIEQNRPDMEVVDHYIETVTISSESGQ
jgi:uncharacterized protein